MLQFIVKFRKGATQAGHESITEVTKEIIDKC